MVYSFIANSMLTEDIVIDFVPDTAAPEEGVGVALLNERLCLMRTRLLHLIYYICFPPG